MPIKNVEYLEPDQEFHSFVDRLDIDPDVAIIIKRLTDRNAHVFNRRTKEIVHVEAISLEIEKYDKALYGKTKPIKEQKSIIMSTDKRITTQLQGILKYEEQDFILTGDVLDIALPYTETAIREIVYVAMNYVKGMLQDDAAVSRFVSMMTGLAKLKDERDKTNEITMKDCRTLYSVALVAPSEAFALLSNTQSVFN